MPDFGLASQLRGGPASRPAEKFPSPGRDLLLPVRAVVRWPGAGCAQRGLRRLADEGLLCPTPGRRIRCVRPRADFGGRMAPDAQQLPAQQQQLPAQQQRLIDAFCGTWLGDLRSFPSPWDPAGGVARGRTQARSAVGGALVTTDYAEERDGQITFRGHGVYGWDGAANCYRMYWFDSVQPTPTLLPASGFWVDDELVFEVATDIAEHRYSYRFVEPGYYIFTISLRRAGQDWRVYAEGHYARQG